MVRFESLEDLIEAISPEITQYEEILTEQEYWDYTKEVVDQIKEIYEDHGYAEREMMEETYLNIAQLPNVIYMQMFEEFDNESWSDMGSGTWSPEDNQANSYPLAKREYTGNEEPTSVPLSQPQYDSHLVNLVDEVVNDYMVYQKMLENEGLPLWGMSFSEWYAMKKPKNPHFEDTNNWYSK